jgi:hypothetical protein
VGPVFCHTPPTSATERFAFLNNMVGVFEYETYGTGNSSGKIWEWKLLVRFLKRTAGDSTRVGRNRGHGISVESRTLPASSTAG